MLSVTVEELLDELAQGTPVAAAGPRPRSSPQPPPRSRRWRRGLVRVVGRRRAAAAQAEPYAVARCLAEEDAEAVEAFIAARGCGGDRAEQRDFRLGRTLHRAADVPLSIVEAAATSRCSRRIPPIAAPAMFVPTRAAAAFLAHGAARAAAHLVEINLATVAGDERVSVRTASSGQPEPPRTRPHERQSLAPSYSGASSLAAGSVPGRADLRAGVPGRGEPGDEDPECRQRGRPAEPPGRCSCATWPLPFRSFMSRPNVGRPCPDEPPPEGVGPLSPVPVPERKITRSRERAISARSRAA